jgi:hypothetical protein
MPNDKEFKIDTLPRVDESDPHFLDGYQELYEEMRPLMALLARK